MSNIIKSAQEKEKSQYRNRDKAMALLKTRLFNRQPAELDAERAGNRLKHIRNYNYLQGGVTDHRINLTLYNLTEIISGDSLSKVITVLIKQYKMDSFAMFDEGIL